MKYKMLFIVAFAGVFVLSASAEFFSATSGELCWLELPTVQHYESIPTDPTPLTNLIDQNQPSATTYMAGFTQGGLAQSFQQTNSNVSGAGIFLQENIGTTDNVTIQLWDGIPGGSSVMLAEATAAGTAGQWIDVFWTPVAVIPGTTYFLVFTGNTSLGISGDTSNPYPYGCVYANDFSQFPTFDYTFRTYWEDNVSLDRTTWTGIKAMFN